MGEVSEQATKQHCPECGAAWHNSQTCADFFDLMLFWELDHQLWDVHHLMVLCYNLQHPARYSPEGLAGAKKLLVEFLEKGIQPIDVRHRDAQALDSGARVFKIAGTPERHGEYAHPVRWTMTAADVTAAGIDAYYKSIRAWAGAVLESLRNSENM